MLQAGIKQDSAATCFKQYPDNDMLRWTLDRSEDVYHSSAREPLGKSWVRGHTLPPGLGIEAAFGQQAKAQQDSSIGQAQQAIAPVDRAYDVRTWAPTRYQFKLYRYCMCPCELLQQSCEAFMNECAVRSFFR